MHISTQNLHRLGASTFVVNNIGPIGCIPENRNEFTGECDEIKNEPINVHNNNLAKILGEMAEKLTDSRFFLADSHGLFYAILAYPGFYGKIIISYLFLSLSLFKQNFELVTSFVSVYRH